MRLLIDTILGTLTCVSITFPWFTNATWVEGLAYFGIAVLLSLLMLLLHLKPQDNTDNLIDATRTSQPHSSG